MRQFCDLIVKVIPIRAGTGVSKNSKRMHSYPKKASIDVCIEVKTENSNGCQNGGMAAVCQNGDILHPNRTPILISLALNGYFTS